MTEPDIVSFTEDRSLTTDEIGMLAGLISDETDYYTILGVDYAASRDEINKAYCLAVQFFHPAKCRELTQRDRVLHWKLSCALKRIEEAFSILSNRGRRQRYDEVRSRQLISNEIDRGIPGAGPLARGSASSLLAQNHPNRRRVERIPLRLPAVVTLDRLWQETTESEDVSPLGIRVQLSRAVEPGTLLRLDLPMPGGLRTRDFSDEIYAVNGFAIRTTQTESKQMVAVEFV